MVINIVSTLRESALVRTCWGVARARATALLYRISPVLLARLRYRTLQGRWPDLEKPKTFDEKLLWLMLFWRDPLKARCGDKYGLRGYVEECGLGHLLPQLIGVYRTSSEIDFGSLPNRFVLKCTHGCQMNVICKDKATLDVEATKSKLDAWLKVDYGTAYGELHYSEMTPRVICEEFLDDLENELPIDYKVYCFAGKAHFTMVCTERKLGGKARYYYYDRDWVRLTYSRHDSLPMKSVPRPRSYDEMIAAAERLSQPFPFVRVDFYDIDGRVVIGEMTFTPAGCIDPGYTDTAQFELGNLIKLPCACR